MAAIRAFLLSLLLVSSVDLVFSLYDDQVGLMDWHQEYIGKVKQAIFQTQKAGRKRVVVSTEENVIASLDLRRGDIFWRHVLGSSDVVDEIGIALGKYVVSLSSSGSILRAWNFPEGQLAWECFLQGSQPSKSLLHISPTLKADKDHVMFIFGVNVLYAVSSIDGEVIWKRDLAAESVEVQDIILPSGSSTVYVVGFSGSSQFEVLQYDIKNGDLVKNNSFSYPGGFYGEALQVSSNTLVTLDASRITINSINILDDEISLKSTSISDLIGTTSGEAVILPSKLTGKFALRVNGHVVIVKVDEEGKLELIEKVSGAVTVSDDISVSEDQQAFGLVEQSGSTIQLSVKHATAYHGDLIKESTEVDPQKGLVHKVFISNYIRSFAHSYSARCSCLEQGRWACFSVRCNNIRATSGKRGRLCRKSRAQPVRVAKVEAESGLIRGYALKGNCISEVSDDFCFDSRNIWTIVFPVESEKIISTATRASHEVVHTQAKIIADQDVMYKYISNNLLFVATVQPKAAGPIGSATPEESGLVVYLIDTITGRILHRMNHYGAQGPVCAVLSENWVVYHYFNLRAHRYEISVLEIYDQSRADNKNVWKLVLGKHNLSAPVSSYSIITKFQSYFFTHSVKTIAVTSTAKGITSKQLLIGNIGDQILALDKRYLDPHRSVNPTQAEKEEGIIPLTEALPIIPQSYVTHALKVEGIRGIVTITAKLESTTHVFAYGVDLFYTRMAPSKTYDSLTEDFSYALLLLTIFVLVTAIFATWILSERKELQEKWK